MDTLEEMVVKMFSEIKNKNIKAETWPEHPFNAKEHFQKKWYIVPVSEMKSLILIFPAPDLTSFYKSQV